MTLLLNIILFYSWGGFKTWDKFLWQQYIFQKIKNKCKSPGTDCLVSPKPEGVLFHFYIEQDSERYLGVYGADWQQGFAESRRQQPPMSVFWEPALISHRDPITKGATGPLLPGRGSCSIPAPAGKTRCDSRTTVKEKGPLFRNKCFIHLLFYKTWKLAP